MVLVLTVAPMFGCVACSSGAATAAGTCPRSFPFRLIAFRLSGSVAFALVPPPRVRMAPLTADRVLKEVALAE